MGTYMKSWARSGVVGLVVWTLAVTGCVAPPPAEPPEADVEAIALVDAHRLTDRLLELTIDTGSVGRTQLRLLLPSTFDEDPERRWPVLYLLHGGGGSFVDWTDSSDVERMTADLDLIVAMPDSGPGATYVDWAFPDAAGRRPRYETYITHALPAFLSKTYRASDRAAIAGVSAGGFGAMSYAARHPDRYRAVAGFSANLDTRDGDELGPWLSALPTLALEGAFPLGDPVTHEVRWRGHNPLDLAPNIAGLDVYVSNGNGNLGPLSTPEEIIDFIMLESSTERRSLRFVARLKELGIAVLTNFYGDGTHSFRYWNRELDAALPMLTAALERDRPAPTEFVYRTVEERFSVWGWSFEVTGRTDLAFTDIAVSGDRVTATGNGTLQVTAPSGARAVVDLGNTAERYGPGPDAPGPRPLGPAVVVHLEA